MEELHKGYYTVIPATVRYDKNLKWLSIILYGEISALCNEKGYCWATNKYFSDLFGVSVQTISSCITELKENNHISVIVTYKEGSKEIDKRYIKINGGIIDVRLLEGKSRTKSFVKPTVEEIHEYCIERKNSVDANKFFDYYESKGWLVGKTKMKDWKAAVRTWENNSFNNKSENNDYWKKDKNRLTKEDVKAVYKYNANL